MTALALNKASLPTWLAPKKDAMNLISIWMRLVQGYTVQDEIRAQFGKYAASGKMHLDGWRAFNDAEQGRSEQMELKEAFESTCDSTRGGTLDYERFALMLLSPENRAVPVGAYAADHSQPLAHYWVAMSHNSYVIGDQLTGISTADAYRRQLLQAQSTGCSCRRRVIWTQEAM